MQTTATIRSLPSAQDTAPVSATVDVENVPASAADLGEQGILSGKRTRVKTARQLGVSPYVRFGL